MTDPLRSKYRNYIRIESESVIAHAERPIITQSGLGSGKASGNHQKRIATQFHEAIRISYNDLVQGFIYFVDFQAPEVVAKKENC